MPKEITLTLHDGPVTEHVHVSTDRFYVNFENMVTNDVVSIPKELVPSVITVMTQAMLEDFDDDDMDEVEEVEETDEFEQFLADLFG